MPEIVVKLGERLIHRYHFDKDVLSIGRARDNDIVIENLSVSRNHARIKNQDGKFVLVDMNSSNGTLVNGVKITQTEIAHEDQITVGKHTLIFLYKDEEPAPAAPEPVAPPRQQELRPRAPTPEPVSYKAEGTIGMLSVQKGKQAGQHFKVYKAETSIGRAPANDIRIHDWLVSNKHLMIRRDGQEFTAEDLGSWRGTELSGQALASPTVLKEGDTIVLGTTVLSFHITEADSVPQSAPVEISEQPSAPPLPAEPAEEEPVPHVPAAEVDAELDSVRYQPPAEDDDAAIDLEVEPEEEEFEEEAPEEEPVEAAEDEYAPFTDDELEALEADSEVVGHDEEEERHRREMWEIAEAEKMFDRGQDSEQFSLVEPPEELAAEEEEAAGEYNPHISNRSRMAVDDMEQVDEEMEEEEALYDGPMGDYPPYGGNEPGEELPPAEESSAAVAPSSGSEYPPEIREEVRLWEKALKNKSPIIRKNAARELKRLTGKDYDWQSEPTGH